VEYGCDIGGIKTRLQLDLDGKGARRKRGKMNPKLTQVAMNKCKKEKEKEVQEAIS
jgi:hypothetical protein